MNRDELEMLTNLQTGEVSLVKRGANKKKRFPIFKSQEGNMDNEMEILEAVLKTEVDEESKIEELFEKKLSPKAMGAVKGALRLLSSYKDELPSDVMNKLAAAAGYSKPDGGYPSPKQGQEKEKDKEKEKEMMKKDDVEKKDLDPKVEDMLKSRDDRIQELEKKNNEFAKTLKDEKDRRELDNWIAKAKDELSHFPGKSAEELGSMLKSLQDTDPKIAEEQFEQMKKASDMLKTSEVFKTSGTPGGGDGSAIAQIEKMADQVLEKSESLNMTREKAIRKVLDSRPDLYDKYLEENPAQRRS